MEFDSSLDAPYPLKKKFYKIVVPGFIIMAIVITIALGQTGKFLIQKAYLKISENRSAIIDRALDQNSSQAWQTLQASTQPLLILKSAEGKVLLDELRKEVKELGLSKLTIYAKEGLIIFSSTENLIGTYDPSSGYKKAVRGKHSIIEKETASGKQYELYVRIPNNYHSTVMELYEPVSYLNILLLTTLMPIIVFMLLTLGIILWLMRKLIAYAQDDIIYRTNIILDYKERLQQLVSREAITTLRSNEKDSIQPKIVTVTILFSDIRGFTNYCDNRSPKDIVSFLNQVLCIEIYEIEKNKGDIDKIIGDAVLAFFQGKGSEMSAFMAAKGILDGLADKDLPRGVGIGIFTGEVIIGSIGTSNRKDFTVIGDTVNIASRLCSAAKENEIVLDTKTYAAIEKEEINTEKLTLKGKSHTVDVHRIRYDQASKLI